MSKSRGNIVRTETILDVLGADALRYFLLREVVFGTGWIVFVSTLWCNVTTPTWQTGWGNLASRTLTMINRYFKGEIAISVACGREKLPPTTQSPRRPERRFANSLRCSISSNFLARSKPAWGLVAAVDKYIVENEPWSLGEKQDDESRARVATVLYTSAEPCGLRLRWRIRSSPMQLPKSGSRWAWATSRNSPWRTSPGDSFNWEQNSAKCAPVFPRADKSAIERMQTDGRSAERAGGRRTEAAGTTQCDAKHRFNLPWHPHLRRPQTPGKIRSTSFAKIECASARGESCRASAQSGQTAAAGNRHRHGSAAGSGRHRRGLCA